MAAIVRELQQMRADFRDDLTGIRSDLGKLVPRESWELRSHAQDSAHAQLAAEVAALKMAREEDQKKAAADKAAAEKERRSLRRFVLGTLIVPIVAVVLAYILTLRGGA